MRFALLTYLSAAVTALHAEPPFNFASTPGKLPKQVRPTDYAIRIKPDIKQLTFSGVETVKLNVERATSELVLNAADLAIRSAQIDGKTIPKRALKFDAKSELLTITAAEALIAGEHTLALEFTGKINQFGRGLFYGKYQEQGTDVKKLFLGTQFEPTDARRLFPCWDEPGFRARFQLTTIVPENWMAVSNMPVDRETKVTCGRAVEFQLTPSMSTYLLVFCAGEFDAIESEVDGVKLRIITTKGKAESARYALEVTAQILHYYNEYFGVPYPLPKLDQLAIPGGFGGAMENWGGITYYETALLFDPANSSATTKQTVYEVIAHEVAHQWFGDLVTMAWWDNLWLNEGFASWMGTKCTARFNPQWEVWHEKNLPRDPARRTGIAKEQAMEGDARATTHPIQQKIETEAEANDAFDDITYKKGQSFLRMLESFLGEEVFRDGIRRYIEANEYSNSTTADLWKALTDASGKPVTEIAAGWTEQPGFPVVGVKREPNNKVVLSQERFTINFQNSVSFIWQIPLTYLIDGQSAPATLLMSEKTAALEDVPDDRALKLNIDGTGNYRVAYDEASWKLLLATLPGMNVPDQVNLLSDAWASVQQGRQPLSFYLDLVDRLPASTALAVREQIINAFDSIDHLLAGTAAREIFRRHARAVLRPTLSAIGFQQKADEPVTASLLRASLVQQLGLFGDEDVIKSCRQNFDNYLKDPTSVASDLRSPTFAVAMRYGDATTWQKLHELGLKTASTEDKQYYYDALAFATDPRLLQKSLGIALTEELPTSRAVFMVPKVARESDRPDLAWGFTKKNLKPLLAKVDALDANTYLASLFTFFSDPARVEELKDFAKKNLSEASRKPVEIASDEIQFRADFRKRLIEQIPRL